MEFLNIHLSPFFEWLIRASLQGSLLIVLILLVQTVLRDKLHVNWRYGLWLLLLVRLSLPYAPTSRISLFNLIPEPVWQEEAAFTSAGENVGMVSSSSAKVVRESPSRPKTIDVQESGIESKPGASSEAEATEIPHNIASTSFKSVSKRVLSLLPIIWLSGAVVLAVYVFARNFYLWRAIKRERPITDQELLDLLEDCKIQMGIQTIVGLVMTDRIKSPALFGVGLFLVFFA